MNDKNDLTYLFLSNIRYLRDFDELMLVKLGLYWL